MRYRLIALSTLSALLRMNAAGQASSREIPVFGFSLRAGAALRALNGMPGAAHLGGDFPLPDGIARLDLAPGQAYAVIEGTNQAAVRVLKLSGIDAGKTAAIDAPAASSILAFSPRGGSAAFYYSDSRKLRVLTGLPAAPTTIREFDLSGQSVLGVAVSDDGDCALALTENQALLLRPGSSPVNVFTASSSTVAQFVANSHDILLADAHSQVYLISGLDGAVTSRLLAGEADGLSNPISLADYNGQAIVANANSGKLVLIDIASGSTQTLTCPHPVSHLSRLRAASTFLLADGGDGPAWILDFGSAGARILFVPAIEEKIQ